jgi:hypothetical protein
VKNYLCNVEGLAGATSSALFESLSCQAALEESAQLSLRSHHGHGLLEDEPMAVVVEAHDVRMRQAARDGQSKELTDADLREYRYGTRSGVCYTHNSLLSSLLLHLQQGQRHALKDVFHSR